MKVIHLISGGDTGGAKTHVHTLLQGLNRHIQADMVCFTDGPFAQEAKALGIPVEVMAGHNSMAVLKLLKRKILDGGYDIIHCHGARGNMMGALVRQATGLPVVTTVHSDPKLDYMGRPLSRITYGTINAWALRKIPYHICVSDSLADDFIRRGFDPQRIFTLYNGLDFDKPTLTTDRRVFLSSLGVDWPEDAVIAGIAARLNPVKDIATLLRGFAAAWKEQPRLRLIIAGDGQEEGALKQLAQQLGVTGQVCFAGWVKDTDSFYHALDINTLTSLSEGFPYALPEGARYALPTVATPVGGVPSLIEHGVTGLLFQPRDHEALARHLAALAADPGLRRRLGASLLEKASRDFSLKGAVRRQLDIYEAICRSSSRPKGGKDGVVICGAYGRGNAGDEAILKAIIAELRAIDPDMPLWVMTRKPRQTRLAHRVHAVYTFNFPGFTRRMSKSRLYVNGGGSLIQDVTSRRSLWFYLYTLGAAKRRGCKVMMYGCGIGPVRSPRNRCRAGKIIDSSVDLITLRDRASREELRSMGAVRPETVLAADPTVILPSAPRPVADHLLEQAGLRPGSGQRYLGVSVRPWPGFENKVSVFADAIRYAYNTYGLIPVFIPIEPRLDMASIQQVTDLLGGIPRAVLSATLTTEHIIGLFSRMDVVMAMRLHALVFSACHGVPLVGVVYDPKVSSFLDAVGQDLYSSLDQLTAPLLKSQLDAAVVREHNSSLLAEQAGQLRELEQNNSVCARKLLGV